MQELINDKILNFKNNGPSIDILIARSDNDDVKGSLKTLETYTYQKDVETLKASIGNIGAVISSAQNGQVITTRKLMKEIRSSSIKEITYSSNGKPLVVSVQYHQSESSKYTYQRPLFVPPPVQNQNYNRNQTGPLRPPQFDQISMVYTKCIPRLIQRSLVFPQEA